MIEKFKKMPWSVKLAAAFLLSLYILMCVTAPPMAAGFTVMALIFWAIFRIIDYVVTGK